MQKNGECHDFFSKNKNKNKKQKQKQKLLLLLALELLHQLPVSHVGAAVV